VSGTRTSILLSYLVLKGRQNLKPVRVAVVGAGNMGIHHARIYSQLPQTELVGIVDISEQRGQACAEKYATEFIADYQDLFERVDAVNIVVPTSLHYPIAVEFLRRGIHVLVEKPITVDLIQAKRLIDLSKKSGCILQVGHLERFNPAVKKLRECAGKPVYIETQRVSYPTDRNLDVGVVWDLMIHDIDILLNLVNSPVVDVHAVGMSVYSDFEDIAQVQLVFKSGTIASLLASRVSGEKLRKLRLTEESGTTYALDFIDQTVVQMTPPVAGKVSQPCYLPVQKDEPLRLELAHFAECVKMHRTPLVSGEDGKRALELAMQVLARMKMVKNKSITGKELTALAG
jgi:predicted dehydrogenase